MVTAFLAWSLLAFPQGYTDAQTKDEAMFQVRWGAEYLMKLWRPATRAADGYTLIYQVGNWSLESQYWGTYEDLTAANMPRPGYNISTASGKLVCTITQSSYAMWTGFTCTDCLSLCAVCLIVVLWAD